MSLLLSFFKGFLSGFYHSCSNTLFPLFRLYQTHKCSTCCSFLGFLVLFLLSSSYQSKVFPHSSSYILSACQLLKQLSLRWFPSFVTVLVGAVHNKTLLHKLQQYFICHLCQLYELLFLKHNLSKFLL